MKVRHLILLARSPPPLESNSPITLQMQATHLQERERSFPRRRSQKVLKQKNLDVISRSKCNGLVWFHTNYNRIYLSVKAFYYSRHHTNIITRRRIPSFNAKSKLWRHRAQNHVGNHKVCYLFFLSFFPSSITHTHHIVI